MTNKIKNLEFLRIIGCLAILGVHLFLSAGYFGSISPNYSIFQKAYDMTKHGFLAVDLFFILSGFFFALNLNTTKSLGQFLKKKLIRLYPVLIFMLLIGWLGAAVFNLYDLSIYPSILSLFGLNGTGFVKSLEHWQQGSSQFWYVSAMLWVFALYFYLFKNYQKKNVNLVLALLIFFSYSLLINNSFDVSQMIGLFFKGGMCRALGGIGIGCFIAQWYSSNKEKIQDSVLDIYQTLFVTFVEFLCLFFTINNLLFHEIKFDNYFIFILVFTLTIILFLYNKGFISRLLNQDIFPYLAKYTYSIYMVHCFVIFNLNNFLWSKHEYFVINHPRLNIVLAYILCISLGVLVYHLIEKPASKYLKENWK